MDMERVRLWGCYHEAGHAVVSLARGHEVQFAMVCTEGRPELSDYVQHRFKLYVESTHRLSRIEKIAVNIAGRCAEWYSYHDTQYKQLSYDEFMEAHRGYEDDELQQVSV